MGPVGTIILTPLAVLFVFIGYQIKYCGRVEWISGVTDASALQTPEALSNWVGGMMIVLAIIMASTAAVGLILPEPQGKWVGSTFVTVILLTLAIGSAGAWSRGKRKSN